jgi:hypothetical protein
VNVTNSTSLDAIRGPHTDDWNPTFGYTIFGNEVYDPCATDNPLVYTMDSVRDTTLGCAGNWLNGSDPPRYVIIPKHKHVDTATVTSANPGNTLDTYHSLLYGTNYKDWQYDTCHDSRDGFGPLRVFVSSMTYIEPGISAQFVQKTDPLLGYTYWDLDATGGTVTSKTFAYWGLDPAQVDHCIHGVSTTATGWISMLNAPYYRRYHL